MIKGICFKKVEISKEEFDYYEELVQKYSGDSFEDLFDVDNSGKITMIKPRSNIPWEILVFFQNLMINQWLRSYDRRIEHIEREMKKQ